MKSLESCSHFVKITTMLENAWLMVPLVQMKTSAGIHFLVHQTGQMVQYIFGIVIFID